MGVEINPTGKETVDQMIKDSNMIFTAVSTSTVENYKEAEKLVVFGYVPDTTVSRSGISHALKRLKKHYEESILHDFSGMTEEESIDYQLDQWVKGKPVHNPIRDECCPDFSCCRPDLLMPEETRKQFAEAVKAGDKETAFSILGMAISGMAADLNKNVHIVGETEN